MATGGESCDGLDLRGRSCPSLGFSGGTLACRPICLLDLGGCTGSPDAGAPDAAPVDSALPSVCGDGLVRGAEQCDDGNDQAGDCCDGCRAEPGCEVEPNDVPAQARPLPLDGAGHAVVKGWLAPSEDVDTFTLTIPAGQTGDLRVILAPTPDVPCPDIGVEVLSAEGFTIAFAAPSFQEGACAILTAPGLPAGAAAVRVVDLLSWVAPIPYTVVADLKLSPCGDGVVQGGQECDGAQDAGCTPACVLAGSPEREPDDQVVAAVGQLSPPFAVNGHVDHAPLDDDWIAIRLALPGHLRVVVTGWPSDVEGQVELDTFDGQTLTPVPFFGDVTHGPGLPAGVVYLRLRSGARLGTPYRVLVRQVSACGNGVVEPPEECDGGALCDGCRKLGACGDGVVAGSETCDDGNTEPGDCCDERCAVEKGCEVEPNDDPDLVGVMFAPIVLRGTFSSPFDVDYFNVLVMQPTSVDLEVLTCAKALMLRDERFVVHEALAEIDTCPRIILTVPTTPNVFSIGVSGGDSPYFARVDYLSVCGDGIVQGTETCDGDADCVARGCDRQAVCGDGIITRPETCDGDAGCAPGCGIGPACGDGNLDDGEACDDGNTDPGDGCAPDCTIESLAGCGDGLVQPPETCDDGNSDDGDGCDAGCAAEAGHRFEVEPNDDGTPAVADDDFKAAAAEGPFSAAILIHGALLPTGDEDVYAVSGPGTVVAALAGPTAGGCGLDAILRARDAAGAVLAIATGGCPRLELRLAAGQTVYLQVGDAGDNSVVPAYVLDVSFP